MEANSNASHTSRNDKDDFNEFKIEDPMDVSHPEENIEKTLEEDLNRLKADLRESEERKARNDSNLQDILRRLRNDVDMALSAKARDRELGTKTRTATDSLLRRQEDLIAEERDRCERLEKGCGDNRDSLIGQISGLEQLAEELRDRAESAERKAELETRELVAERERVRSLEDARKMLDEQSRLESEAKAKILQQIKETVAERDQLREELKKAETKIKQMAEEAEEMSKDKNINANLEKQTREAVVERDQLREEVKEAQMKMEQLAEELSEHENMKEFCTYLEKQNKELQDNLAETKANILQKTKETVVEQDQLRKEVKEAQMKMKQMAEEMSKYKNMKESCANFKKQNKELQRNLEKGAELQRNLAEANAKILQQAEEATTLRNQLREEVKKEQMKMQQMAEELSKLENIKESCANLEQQNKELQCILAETKAKTLQSKEAAAEIDQLREEVKKAETNIRQMAEELSKHDNMKESCANLEKQNKELQRILAETKAKTLQQNTEAVAELKKAETNIKEMNNELFNKRQRAMDLEIANNELLGKLKQYEDKSSSKILATGADSYDAVIAAIDMMAKKRRSPSPEPVFRAPISREGGDHGGGVRSRSPCKRGGFSARGGRAWNRHGDRKRGWNDNNEQQRGRPWFNEANARNGYNNEEEQHGQRWFNENNGRKRGKGSYFYNN